VRTALQLSFLLLGAVIARAGQKDRTLDIYWIDSEGGGSTLIVTPTDEAVLIDSGYAGGRDPGRIVATAKAAGLTKIDHLLLTHFHRDHFGGGAEVAQQLPVGTVYQREIPAGDPDGKAQSTFQVEIKPWREIAAKRVTLAPGLTVPLKSATGGPNVDLVCIYADQKIVAPTAEQMKTKNPLTGTGTTQTFAFSDNDNSAGFVLTFGGFRFFEGGDLTWNIEEKVATPHNVAGSIDVYQANHHGNVDASNPILLKSIAPTVVVMNNGPRKGGLAGGFANLKEAPSVQALYQVHKSFLAPADVQAPAEYIANQEDLSGANAAKCPANVIKLSVAPDAKTYTVSIPATGHSRTYRTKAK
jgi:competence protein ComEC